ncbi:MAG TPA: TetR/AcrR family transcriptional regulator [Bacteroidales bacterium]|nr:TetR/AcrR family transcriptional regulator [Bacteroidales bacterium]
MGIIERKEREKEQRRNDIIDAAEKIFFSKGIDNATMDEIAEQAELSKGTIYLYFKSKEELLFAIDLRAMQILMSLFRESISQEKSTIENLLEIGRAYVRFSLEHEHYFKILLHFEGSENFNLSHDLYALMCSQEEDPMSFLVAMLKKGAEDGTIRSDISPGVLAHCLWSQTTGILKLTKTKDFHIDLKDHSEEEIINSHLEIIYHGILKNT